MRGEDGIALVAVILIMMVVSGLAFVVLRNADHTNRVTTDDRLRVQAIQAAEAGANAAMRRLEQQTGCDSSVSAPQVLQDGTRAVARYQTRIDPAAGDPCTNNQRVIRSWGFAPAASGRIVRNVEVSVKLVPRSGFNFTLFASGSQGIVTVRNTGTVQGDIYAENLDQTQNNINAENVISTGSIDTKDGSVYSGVVWAGGNVSIRQNGKVSGSVLAAGSSAQGNVLLENGVSVGRDVRAKGSISLPTNYTVGGAVSANNPSVLPPPVLDKPVFTWNAANYSPAPMTFASAALASAYLDLNRTNLKGTIYVPDSGGVVALTKGATVTGPLTIVTSGKVDLGGTITASGGPWQMIVVSQSNAGDAISVSTPSTFGPGVEMLLFTGGGVDVKNYTTMTGSIYADSISLKNKLTIMRAPTLASAPPAGFNFTQGSAAHFSVIPLVWRELPPAPPA
ncbi:MAG TPA: hypothetical protein VNE62_01345 [Actinomycetota bacterium]|nr:hypothetical protein [Actinomycetota bacterium]